MEKTFHEIFGFKKKYGQTFHETWSKKKKKIWFYETNMDKNLGKNEGREATPE